MGPLGNPRSGLGRRTIAPRPASTLRTFRRENGDLFGSILNQSIRIALNEGFIDPQQLAIDGMRLRACASTKAVRTEERSTKRLEQLGGVDVSSLTPEEAEKHAAKVAKHTDAIELCHERGQSSVCVTNEMCSLMKFPSGASAPGHRIIATVSGQRERLVVGLVVNASATDYGQLEGGLEDARQRLTDGGLSKEAGLRCAADAGFLGEGDQRFILANRSIVDVVIPPPTEGERKNGDVVMFKRREFTRDESGAVVCPAGTVMKAPSDLTKRTQVWTGQGCDSCPLKTQCTKGKVRKFELDLDKEAAHAALAARYEAEGAQEFYKTRMSTVEPVFSVIESDMQYSRASSRLAKTVLSEVMMKFAAYNINRLIMLVDAREAAARPPRPSRRDYRRNAAAATRARRKRPA
jgi:DNA-binding protein H-NS